MGEADELAVLRGDAEAVGDATALAVGSADGSVVAAATTAAPPITTAPATPAAVIQVDAGIAHSFGPRHPVGHRSSKAASRRPSGALPAR
jgi:hypothetical protein